MAVFVGVICGDGYLLSCYLWWWLFVVLLFVVVVMVVVVLLLMLWCCYCCVFLNDSQCNFDAGNLVHILPLTYIHITDGTSSTI